MSKTRDDIQDEALTAVGTAHRAGVNMSMGSGKTLFGLRHAAKNYTDYCKFLVVYPTVPIMQSWINDAKTYKMEYLLEHIKFCTYKSLHKEQQNDYDVVYLDEMHSLKESHDTWLSKYHGKILGLTGTKPRWRNSEKGKMVTKYAPIVYEYLTDEAVGDMVLNDYRIIVHLLPLSEQRNLQKKKKDGGIWYTSEVKDYQYYCQKLDDEDTKNREMMRIFRMKAMQTYPSKEIYTRKLLTRIQEKCLVFANTKEQAERLGEHCYYSGNPLNKINVKKFETGEIDRLISILQLAAGVTIPHLREGIIMHAFANEYKTSQRIGRFLRLNPDDVCTVHILCYNGTKDVDWVQAALENFNQDKISWINADL